MLLVPVFGVGAYYVHALVMAAVVAALGSPVPILALLLVAGTPWIYRFGCWLERNFGPALMHRERRVVAITERKTS